MNRARALPRPSGRRLSPLRRRALSTQPSASHSNQSAFASTILLPRQRLTSRPDHAEVLRKYLQKTTVELYRTQWEERKGKEVWVLHDGPPYANGNLHIGHAVNKILKDIINRFQVLQGKRVHYVPGWDCHGLPIENKALLTLDGTRRTLPPSTIRAASRQLAGEQIEVQKGEFEKMVVMADWEGDGGTYRTFDRDYEIRQLRLFQKMVAEGLIYRRFRPIYWSPASGTALAEGELQYEDAHVSASVYVSFRVGREEMGEGLRKAVEQAEREGQVGKVGEVGLLVWTTTPWTLPANMAVAVNGDLMYALVRTNDGRLLVLGVDRFTALEKELGPLEVIAPFPGSHFLGTSYHHPFQPPSSPSKPIFAARYVTAESGTGLVHSAPGHGAEDYFAMRSSGLLGDDGEILSPVDGEGRFSEKLVELVGDEDGRKLVGLEVLKEGSEEVIEMLRHKGALVVERSYKHRYPYDWKSGTPVIVRATSQWFANIDQIKDTASRSLDQVHFHPVSSRARLETYIRERSEWCISRQRSWGVPIPALHDVETDEAILTPESLDHIISVLDEKGVEHWWDGPVEDFLPPSLQGRQDLRQGTDTMDVWFDSGTSWSMLSHLHGEEQPEGEARVADVCLEGSDQHRGWFQSLLLTRIISAPAGEVQSPYRALITHGFVMDHRGKKMSKSLGNVVSPMIAIAGGENRSKEPARGADALRLWTASVDYVRDMALGTEILHRAVSSLTKLRNTARYLLGNLDNPEGSTPEPVDRKDMGLLELYMMDQLYGLETTCREAYSTYQFHRVVHSLTDFAITKLSALYFDVTKDSVYLDPIDSPRRGAVITIMNEILRTFTLLLAPITPLLAEEIYDARYKGTLAASVFLEPWPKVNPDWRNDAARKDMEVLLELRSSVQLLLEKARSAKQMGNSLEAVVFIDLPKDVDSGVSSFLTKNVDVMKDLFIVSDVGVDGKSEFFHVGGGWSYAHEAVVCDQKLSITVKGSALHKCPRCWHHNKESPVLVDLCSRCTDALTRLNNDTTAAAP